MKFNLHLAILIILSIVILGGCSSNTSDNSPTGPGVSPPSFVKGTSHHTWGLWQFTADPGAGTLDVVQLRAGNLHLNALHFLEPPPLVNLTLESVEFNGNIVDVSIGLKHPFLGLNEFTGFDVCGILISDGAVTGFDDPDLCMAGDGSLRLLNPDGYSRWWNPAEFPLNDGTMFSYQDGLLGTPDSIVDYGATLNAYKYFCDDLEPNDPLSLVTLENRGMFSAGQKNIRHYTIDMGSVGLLFNYAVDACWAFPNGSFPWSVPDDFPPAANRPEAWRVEITETSNTLWNDGAGGSGGNLSLSIDVYDWHNAGLNTVKVESPGNFDITESSTPTGGGEGYSTYEIDITDTTPAANSIDLLISMESEKVNYGGLLPGKVITSYFTRPVEVSSQSPEVLGWPCFLHDIRHTGVADVVLDPATLELKWGFPTGDRISNSPVISGGTVYFGSKDANVYAVDIASGTEEWHTPVDSEVPGTAAIGIDAIFTGTKGGYMYALSRSDGSELWHYQFTFTGMSGSAGLIVNGAILYDDRLYFTANNGNVYALNAGDGSEIFVSPTPLPGNGNSLHTVPAYYEAEDQLIVTADSFDVICFDALTGDELWRSSVGEFIDCSPSLEGDYVYFTDKEYTRKYDITGPNPPSLEWAEELLDPNPFIVVASGALDDGNYYSLGYFAGKVTAHNKGTGTAEWKMPVPVNQGFIASPAVSGDTIYCVDTHGILYGFDTATGAEVFNYDLGDWATESAIAIAEDRLLVGCNDGNMYCFGATD